MKTAAWFYIPIILAVVADNGLGQGLRGGGGRGAAGWSQARPGLSSHRQQSQGPTNLPSQRAVIGGRSILQQNFPGHTVTFYRRRSGVAFARPPFVSRFIPAPFAPVRYYSYPYRYPYYARHPGVLIIDVPYLAGTSGITSHVPGISLPLVDEPSPQSQFAERGPGQVAPFDPAPQAVVERMLALARMKSDDVLYDLGSGDGRVVIAAAKKFGARAVGFEIDAGLVRLARENARKEGVEDLVEFRQQDFFTADLSPASVVTLYLSYDGNLAVRPQLMQQLKPGARVVSYTFDMGDWSSKVVESYRDKGGNTHMLYLWEIGNSLAFSDAR
jgi:precorrin-6B methylase 2